ncbi:MAG: allophycocyanin subunit alpha [Synechococcales cyanobacterium]
MLTQLQKLSVSVDGRYASDDELRLLDSLQSSFDLRLRAYQKLQASEPEIIKETEARVQSLDPQLLMRGVEDFRGKWRADTVRVLRFSAAAMLLDDVERLKDRLLFWFQTLMRAFRTQKSCEMTYQILQEVVKTHLTPEEAALFLPLLELDRTLLGEGN